MKVFSADETRQDSFFESQHHSSSVHGGQYLWLNCVTRIDSAAPDPDLHRRQQIHLENAGWNASLNLPCTPKWQRNMRILLGEQICILHQQSCHSLKGLQMCWSDLQARLGGWPSVSIQLTVSAEGVSWHFHLLGKLLKKSRAFLSAYFVYRWLWAVTFAALKVSCAVIQLADRRISKVWKPFLKVWKRTPFDPSVVWNTPLTATVKCPNIFTVSINLLHGSCIQSLGL